MSVATKTLLLGGGSGGFLSGDSPAISYILRDTFNVDVAAGGVNGTLATPGPGTRTVTDTENKLSIVGGLLTFAGGKASPASGDPALWYPTTPRLLGKTVKCTLIASAGRCYFGWSTSATGAPDAAIGKNGTTLRVLSPSLLNVGTITNNETYSLAVVQRTSGGAFFLIRGGTEYPTWTLIYLGSSGFGANPRPAVDGLDVTGTIDSVSVSKKLYIPVPLQSDGFSAATTDGAGNAEANGPVGNAYTDVGTWGVAGGVRSCSALTGSGFSYLPCSSSNVIIDAICTRSAGATGIVARYASATDYLIAYLDGTNAKLDKVVAGTTTNLISAAVTYGAAFVLRLSLNGTSARLYYNNLAVGAVATTPAAGSLNHGLYTTDTGATFDNLIIWAKGNEGNYSGLDAL